MSSENNEAGDEPNRNNEAVNNVMERAHIFATENYHEYVTIEHLLWSLLHEKDLQRILTDIGGRPNIIRNEVSCLTLGILTYGLDLKKKYPL